MSSRTTLLDTLNNVKLSNRTTSNSIVSLMGDSFSKQGDVALSIGVMIHTLYNAVKLLHWSTDNIVVHTTLDTIYSDLDKTLDKYVEITTQLFGTLPEVTAVQTPMLLDVLKGYLFIIKVINDNYKMFEELPSYISSPVCSQFDAINELLLQQYYLLNKL